MGHSVPHPVGGAGSPGMRGARPLATYWPVAEKLWWEAAMEEPGLSGCPLSAKTASFQVGEHSDLGQAAFFPKATFSAMSVDRLQGSKPLAMIITSYFAETQGKSLVILHLVLTAWGDPGPPTPWASQLPFHQREAPQNPPPSVGMGSSEGGLGSRHGRRPRRPSGSSCEPCPVYRPGFV